MAAATDAQFAETSATFTVSHGEEEDTSARWAVTLDYIQVVLTFTGFVTNFLTFVTLGRNHDGFSWPILKLLRHQALIDCWVCAMATIVILQPFHWKTGVRIVDDFVCHVWHGQALYWSGVTLSTYNLVLIALERYIAIKYPFRHSMIATISKAKVVLMHVGLYVFTIFVTHGTFIQTSLVDGICKNQYAFFGLEEYFFGFVIFTYLFTYFLPVAIMGTLYGIVIHHLVQRDRDVDLGRSRVIRRASSQLTKTALVVTVIFAVSIGYDLHYYLLGYTGALSYQLNSTIQKVGVFLSNMNSVSNPFVYAFLMPMYRRSLMATFRCLSRHKKHQNQPPVNSVSQHPALSQGTCDTQL